MEEKLAAMAASGSEGKTEVILKSSRSPNARNWVFTLNNYSEEQIEKLYKDLAAKAKSFVFGIEVGKEGTPHLQGQVCFQGKGLRAIEIYREYGAHWEVMKGKLNQATDYCKKDGNYWQYPVIERPDWLIKKLRPWQHELAYRALYEPNYDISNRNKINWLWEATGNFGKTSFALYMYYYYNAWVITCTKSADVLMCINKYQDIYILDFPRAIGDFCPYVALEQVVNGFTQDAKLKKKVETVFRRPPIIICFSNFAPKITEISLDRWNIVNLCPNQDQPT